MSFFKKFIDRFSSRTDQQAYSEGLNRENSSFINKLILMFEEESEIDNDWIERMMVILIEADVSVKTARKLMKNFQKLLEVNNITEKLYAKDFFLQVLNDFYGEDVELIEIEEGRPNVILMVGVNGSGKTTSSAKLAFMYQQQGYKVALVAADTFRAAAVSQLQLWSQRLEIPCYHGQLNDDPSSVLAEASKQAIIDGIDVLICDTAGRLQTKVNLMNELAKMKRVLSKFIDGAPDTTYLVLDATLGQNSLKQAQEFNKATEVDGIILTKMDGTAKGGIIFSIIEEMNLKVAYIGLGEQIDDLRVFQRDLYFNSLLKENVS
ncbi:MAG: signal recognition particle-docking protein FtsY [Erysipelothrix sp.]|nr:signal recognition particle-docking protein FtsY [Erysipelothrix sp.]